MLPRNPLLKKMLPLAVLISLAALSLLYHFIEMLDRWDAPGPSTDSEIEIIVLLTFIGLIFVLRHLLAKLSLPTQSSVCRSSYSRIKSFAGEFLPTLNSEVTAIPPLLLRI